jgi:hypothetical protein
LKLVRSAEATVSRGLALLSTFFPDNLTLQRECILSAFSLTPTTDLFNQVSIL